MHPELRAHLLGLLEDAPMRPYIRKPPKHLATVRQKLLTKKQPRKEPKLRGEISARRNASQSSIGSRQTMPKIRYRASLKGKRGRYLNKMRLRRTGESLTLQQRLQDLVEALRSSNPDRSHDHRIENSADTNP